MLEGVLEDDLVLVSSHAGIAARPVDGDPGMDPAKQAIWGESERESNATGI
jgi:hypothetical protein